jgi:hypothetical protein
MAARASSSEPPSTFVRPPPLPALLTRIDTSGAELAAASTLA